MKLDVFHFNEAMQCVLLEITSLYKILESENNRKKFYEMYKDNVYCLFVMTFMLRIQVRYVV